MVLTGFTRLKEREIKNLITSIKEELTLIKNQIKEIKNYEIPENVKIRIKKLEVTTLGVEEQIVNLEDRMRAIETSFQELQVAITTSNDSYDARLSGIDDEIVSVKEQFNASLQELDDRKEDKPIEIVEEVK